MTSHFSLKNSILYNTKMVKNMDHAHESYTDNPDSHNHRKSFILLNLRIYTYFAGSMNFAI